MTLGRRKRDYARSTRAFSGVTGAFMGFILAPLLLQSQDASAQAARVQELLRSPAEMRAHEAGDLHQADARLDGRERVLRAAYRLGSTSTARLPEMGPIASRTRQEIAQAAAAYLRTSSSAFGLTSVDEELRVVRTSSNRYSAHVTWQQYVGDIPVDGAYVKVSLDAQGQPTFVVSGFESDLLRRAQANGVVLSRSAAVVSSGSARATAAGLFGASARGAQPVLVVLPGDTPAVAWRVAVTAEDQPGDWQVFVDAGSGKPIRVHDLAVRRSGAALRHAHTAEPPAESGVLFEPIASRGSLPVAASRVEGSGRAFEPDPITRAGVPYGGAYVDNNDGDFPALNDQLVDVALSDIALGGDALHRLEGPYVTIIGGGTLNYTPPAEAAASGFAYTRSNNFFEAVNAYYHIDRSQRYVQSIGFNDVQNASVTVNPQAFTADDSQYLSSANRIEFGIGGVDDAEDAGVIWHEYAHALLNGSAFGLVDGGEGSALHEGWADYWAGSYLRGLVEAGKSARLDWESVFSWDSGDGALWNGRTIGVPGVYPADTTCDDPGDGNRDGCNIYADGLVWASTLMEIYDELGKTVTDQLNLQSHRYLSPPTTFRDAAEALLQADSDLFAESNTSFLTTTLAARGYIDVGSVAPFVEHTPLGDSEDVGGNAAVQAVASSQVAAIDSVRLVYREAGGDDAYLRLAIASGDTYSATLDLPSTPGVVEYYLEAYDDQGRVSTLPIAAPASRFTFYVGPDVTAPTVDHTPGGDVSTIVWPLRLEVEATDNLGIAAVTTSYTVKDGSGGTVDNGTFPLAPGPGANGYSGAFPISRSTVGDGYTIEYSIVVTDAAGAANESRSPAAGVHALNVVTSGALLRMDFESSAADVAGTGDWERGAPTQPLQVAHSGANVWATVLDGPYSAAPQTAVLELPSFNLEGLTTSLVFWHWYDFELSSESGVFWDGGNIKVSVNDGPWQPLIPERGYPGAIATSGDNLLAGEAAFGGYSFGWTREVVPLPAATSVRVRFEAGFGTGNTDLSLAYAGWFVDDIVVTTSVQPDLAGPTALSVPPSRIVHAVGTGNAVVTVGAVDNVGIDRVDFLPEPGNNITLEASRFAMDLTDLEQYSVVLDPSEVGAGDQLAYRIRLADFDGNEVVVPDQSSAPFVIDYRTVEYQDVLVEAVAAGVWRRAGSRWRAEYQTDGDEGLSGLVLAPITLADNAESLRLVLDHSYLLDAESGANVKYSVDDGQTWQVLTPESGYDDTWQVATGHPLSGEGVYRGISTTTADTFLVTGLSGQQVRIRLDGGFSGASESGSYWSVSSLVVESVSVEDEVRVPLRLSLDANFPDPFSTSTTLTYTLPQDDLVLISVYDVLGRRVRALLFQEQLAGVHTIQLEAEGLAAGVYYVQLNAGGFRAVEQVVVAR